MNRIVSPLGCDPVVTCVWTTSSGLLCPARRRRKEGEEEQKSMQLASQRQKVKPRTQKEKRFFIHCWLDLEPQLSCACRNKYIRIKTKQKSKQDWSRNKEQETQCVADPLAVKPLEAA